MDVSESRSESFSLAIVGQSPEIVHYGMLLAHVPTATITKELELIRQANGALTLTAKMIVDAARAPESPIHKVFEWDDAIAGERYRLIQARALIRIVGDEQEGPKYVSLRVEGKRGYFPVSEVAKAPDLREQMLRRLIGEIRSQMHRFRQVTGAMGILERALAELEALLQRPGEEE